MAADIHRVTIGGISTACVSRQDLVNIMQGNQQPCDSTAKLLFDINGHGLAMSLFNKSYRDDLNAADIIHADGQPLVTASRWLTKSPVPERSATTDLFHDMANAAQQSGKSFFLLGGSEEVVQACAAEMRRLYPSLIIAGVRNGYFSSAEEPSVCNEINASGADIIWVGLGKPKEQAFCVRNRHRISAGWLVSCGGCFNYVTGTYGRAPLWMQRTGTEWVHRMVTQPRKLLWRYVSTTPIALLLLLLRTGDNVKTANTSRV
ncbi:WecB/TagA/CpsF family glycosyltransferase [Rhizobium sp. B21/90]|uniref:WecB/TagA/CpsF family glycosyltransferase n=1 Tax=Rhizobium sp. B21/90 TaxID=2819993 RepID=UPI001C5B70C2|nr:WecB/TagA/CpsF family glycosyltransferase [Rhizobium sp. B21/90]QYA03905.1 WecB/TagA/CpsF family glycosyltransferase [Rhizobium sp. B21/90]